MSSSKRVIITGDDFGLALPVNEAIEVAFREGVLSSTSLLIGEQAAEDAIQRAHRNPALCVGLHVAVCDGRPVLPSTDIPLLVNARGELHGPLRAFVQLFLLGWGSALRAQLEAEIRAQFEAFRQAGLSFDHVDGHNNMQLHPVVLPILMRVAHEYGATAVRVPYEPLIASWRARRSAFVLRLGVWLVLYPWSAYVRRRLQRAGFTVNDFLFGIVDCGAMNRTLLRSVIEHLPDGLSEIHCHPATRRCAKLDESMPSYGHEAELAALIDPDVLSALDASGVQRVAGYGAVARDVRE